MKALGLILILCLALAALRAVLLVLCVAIVLLLVWGALFRPAETFGFLAYSTILTLLHIHPLACLIVIGLAIIVSAGAEPQGPTQP